VALPVAEFVKFVRTIHMDLRKTSHLYLVWIASQSLPANRYGRPEILVKGVLCPERGDNHSGFSSVAVDNLVRVTGWLFFDVFAHFQCLYD